jgi:hypothetical protein
VNKTTLTTRLTRSLLIAGVASLLLTTPGMSHHSGEMFEREVEVTLTGTVAEFRYINPHSWLLVDIENEDGTITRWGFEAEGPQDLMHGGVRKSDLPPGARITVTGRPMRDGRPAAAWSTIVKEDGSLLDWRTPGSD